MHYVGIDYHKKYSHVTAVDEKGGVFASRRLNNDAEEFREFFADIGAPVKAVMEASRTWGVLYDLLEEMEMVDEVVLAHPAKVRMIAEAKVKTDKIDATMLAQLLRGDFIPAAHIPSREVRRVKEMIRQRAFLVRLRTRLKNRMHVLVDRLHVPLPAVTDLFGKRGVAFMQKLPLEGIDAELMREDLDLLGVLNRLIKDSGREVSEATAGDPRVALVQSMPGIGEALAGVVAMEIDEIGRFSRPEKLVAYAGLAPSTYSSGGKCSHGKLMKMSNKWLRWAFVEAAWVAVRVSPYCRTYFEKIARRKGKQIAVAALARRLAIIAWHLLTEHRPYEERPAPRRRFVEKHTDPVALV